MPFRSPLAIADPFYLCRRALRCEIGRFAAELPGRVLDIGCGVKPYRALFPGPEYIGVEIPIASRYGSRKLADVYYDGHVLPFPDASFDVVLSSQVLEHVFDPTEFLGEIYRVLRPGGHFLLSTPFVWDEHEQPFDYARYSSFGLTHLAKANGFSVLVATKTLTDASVIIQISLAYVYKVLCRAPRGLRTFACAAIAAPCNVLGLLVAAVSPRNNDLYIDNVVLWQKPDRQ
jgi:SAM-dependent methyltransferase